MRNSKDTNVIFESPEIWHRPLVIFYMFLEYKIWVIEPFHAYHHEKGIRFYPKQWPKYIKKLVSNGKVLVLPADKLNPKDIYLNSANKAVDTVEIIYPIFKKDYLGIINLFCHTLNSLDAENVLRKEFCDKLAVFYSVNNMIACIKSCFLGSTIKIRIEKDVFFYRYFESLALKSGVEVFDGRDVKITGTSMQPYILNFIKNLTSVALIGCLALASTVLYPVLKIFKTRHKKRYKFAITILSSRQLRNNKRRADFIVNDKTIKQEDVVFIPLITLNAEQKKEMHQLKGDIFLPPSKFVCVKPAVWLKLLLSTLQAPCFNIKHFVIFNMCKGLLEYFRWVRIAENVEFKNLITHCDFSSSRIGRGIALERTGVETWYFSDSINFSVLYVPSKEVYKSKHPFWAYLKYDNFITVNNCIRDYFCAHPNSVVSTHIVGSIWSDCTSKESCGSIELNDKFIISAFDTTYTVNSFTSYDEGIAFANNLLKMLDEFSDALLIIKEKKGRDIHKKLDPIIGNNLVNLYRVMAKHPRVKVYDNQSDALDLILSSNLVVSFPFTSPTFEALSANRPAIWHDPKGLYQDTVYAKIPGVVTNGYEGLRYKIQEVRLGKWTYPFPENSPLMDPFRNGKALDRFRELLARRA
jgi:polysaccharide biosynthesis PFTS motif protein